MEPQKDVWNFSLLDRAIGDANTNGIPVILTLGQTPAWASRNPHSYSYYGMGATTPPVDIEDWKNYVRQLVVRYRGRIHYYEVWNEPNSEAFFSGTLEDLIELTKTAREVIKSEDPDAMIIGPSATTQQGYLLDFLNAGGGPLVDIVSYHLYSYGEAPEDDVRILADIETILDNSGESSREIWITEGAAGTASSVDDPTTAALLMRKFIIDTTFGSGHFSWHSWGPGDKSCLGTTTADGNTPTLAGSAFSVMSRWIANYTGSTAQIDANGNWQIALNSHGKVTAYLVWNPQKDSIWNPPSGFTPNQIEDLSGPVSWAGSWITVTSIPILISSGQS